MKELQINFALRRIKEILDKIKPGNNWKIEYVKFDESNINKYKTKYQLNGEYFMIYIDGDLIYTIDVTGDSILTAIKELMDKLAAKF